jgi:hypothetical protein
MLIIIFFPYSFCCQWGNGKAGRRKAGPGWLTNDHVKQRAVTLNRLFLLKQNQQLNLDMY